MTDGRGFYSERYSDNVYQYRHVTLIPEIAGLVPKNHLMTETEWRNLGLNQSENWVHYMIHNPERHILLFRRELKEATPALPAAEDRYGQTIPECDSSQNVEDDKIIK